MLWKLLTFGSLIIQIDTLCILFTYFTDDISIIIPFTWKWWLGKAKSTRSIVFTLLNFIFSDSCFYRRECSRGRLKLVIEDGGFESLKWRSNLHIGIYIFCLNIGTCTWTVYFIFTWNIEGLFCHVIMGFNIVQLYFILIFWGVWTHACKILICFTFSKFVWSMNQLILVLRSC